MKRENIPTICHRCRLLLTNLNTSMTLKTEVDTYSFCLRCLKKGFTSLVSKPFKSPDEISLLQSIRDFLKAHKKSRES